jgi:hypothetical protein
MSICTNGNFENVPPPIPGAMNSARYIQQQTNYQLFDRIQAYNSNVSTLRSTNPAAAGSYSYYVMSTYAEINSFNNGRMLHIQLYPNSNWDVVQQN